MSRVRSLEGREAGIIAWCIQKLFRTVLGRSLNSIKVQAHSTRAMLASFFANAIINSGRWAVGTEIIKMVRIRAAARNGCPF